MWPIIYVWVTFEDPLSYLVLFMTCGCLYYVVRGSLGSLSAWPDKESCASRFVTSGDFRQTLLLNIMSECLSPEIDLEMYAGQGVVGLEGVLPFFKSKAVFSIWKELQSDDKGLSEGQKLECV